MKETCSMMRLIFAKEVSLTTVNSQTQGSVGSLVTVSAKLDFGQSYGPHILVKNFNELGIGEYEVINV